MPKKILVVDDDPDIQEFCRTILEAAGYLVVSAASAREGHQQVTTGKPDLVVLDVIMEEADSGFKVAQDLAKSNPGLPILMLSSIASAAEQVFDTSTLPVAALVSKPITPRELLQQVERLLAAGKRPA
ncbi:MAG TPA: response regulator [Thermoanaerobaculales bacterium]|nr:response regulator [Thermoanaerobaculales bacterium]HPA79740.1 response regulator [Thermoanaerobaculales bacterium]HQL31359.1 response regulator [Thermoanaerobaculales bacterium]HQN96076.1 response regulator [Thermoanaerobaculales bacterium]HQP42696.1 response regulator [Thermoanaerobaculales bacterium]